MPPYSTFLKVNITINISWIKLQQCSLHACARAETQTIAMLKIEQCHGVGFIGRINMEKELPSACSFLVTVDFLPLQICKALDFHAYHVVCRLLLGLKSFWLLGLLNVLQLLLNGAV